MKDFQDVFSSSGGVFVIAEVGTSHQGDKGLVRKLIAAAADAGADCVKFQVVFADEIIHPLTGDVPLPGGKVRLYDRFKELERDEAFYAFCREETEKVGLVFLASPFGVKSAQLLRRIGAAWFKVASPELNHFPLLLELASYQRPLVLSSGVSHLADIEAALAILPGQNALLHCVTAYPAPPEDYNLKVLQPLSVLFGCPVGVSDHSMDPELVPGVAAAVGARLIEKHLCLDRSDPGLDDPIALDPVLFRKMIKTVREVQQVPVSERLTWAGERFGERTQAVLGSGKKLLADSEKANYERTNRSLHVLRALNAGHVLTAEDVAVLRTEKILRPGLPPQFLNLVLGRTLQRAVADGEGLVWDDLLPAVKL
ncbi:MAG: spore coat protein [Spirochaetales bacterium]|nr:spore coat protein [Spirochaetales bacterium]